MEGESEEAIRRRIATEYQSEGVWSKPGMTEEGQQERDDSDDDPLDAFMAGIEVRRKQF